MFLLKDPKRLTHKPVKATLRLEVERLSGDDLETDMLSECGSFNGSVDGEGHETSMSRHLRNGSAGYTKGGFSGRSKWTAGEKHRFGYSASGGSSSEFGRPDVGCPCLDFETPQTLSSTLQKIQCSICIVPVVESCVLIVCYGCKTSWELHNYRHLGCWLLYCETWLLHTCVHPTLTSSSALSIQFPKPTITNQTGKIQICTSSYFWDFSFVRVGFPLHGCWVFGQIWNIHFLIIGYLSSLFTMTTIISIEKFSVLMKYNFWGWVLLVHSEKGWLLVFCTIRVLNVGFKNLSQNEWALP